MTEHEIEVSREPLAERLGRGREVQKKRPRRGLSRSVRGTSNLMPLHVIAQARAEASQAGALRPFFGGTNVAANKACTEIAPKKTEACVDIGGCGGPGSFRIYCVRSEWPVPLGAYPGCVVGCAIARQRSRKLTSSAPPTNSNQSALWCRIQGSGCWRRVMIRKLKSCEHCR